jgi:hypothetical protein
MGGAGVRPLTGSQRILLRNSSIDVGDIKTITGFASKDSSGSKYLITPGNEGSIRVEHVDLTGIKSVELVGYAGGQAANYRVEIRTDAVGGNMIGQGSIAFGANKQSVSSTIPVNASGGGKFNDVSIVLKADGAVRPGALLKTIRFKP